MGGVASPNAAPTSLTATFVSGTQIDLAWTDNATNESGYKIERKVGSGDFAEIAAIATPGLVAYEDHAVVQDAVYTYRVRAYKGSKNSDYSNEAVQETIPAPPGGLEGAIVGGTPAPAAPSDLTATYNAGDADLAWTLNSTTETSVVVEREDATSGTAPVIIASLPAGSTSYTDIELPEDEEFIYRVGARNSAGTNYSDTDTLVSLPDALEEFTATTVDDDSILLEWHDTVATATSFELEMRTGAAAFAQIDTSTDSPDSHTETGLDPSTTYDFRIRAVNGTGNGPYSATVSATTNAAASTPAAPIALDLTFVSNSRIDLAWTDTASDELGFKVERADDGGAFVEIEEIATPNTATYSDTTVAADTAYQYRVRAYNAVGNSGPTTTESIETLPAAPSSLTATAISDTQIQLSWTDNSSLETGYQVHWDANADGIFGFKATVAAGINGYLDSGLTASTLYAYRVRAVGSQGFSSFSSDASATTNASGTTVTQLTGHLEGGIEIESDEVAEISGTVTANGNVVVHGKLIMRPGATLRFTGIDNSTWSFDSPDAHDVDASDWGLWVHGNGVLDAVGTTKTPWLVAVGSIASFATTVSLADPETGDAFSPVGWLAGDTIAIAPTAANDVEPELRVVQGVSGSTVTLTEPTARAHPAVTVGPYTMTAEILNLTRDVRIEGTGLGQNSHIMFMDHDPPLGGVPQTIKYVQIRYCGQHKPVGTTNVDRSGRYGIHFHRFEDGTQGTVLEGLVVRDGSGHAFVTHESHGVTHIKNIAYNTMFAQFWWDEEDPSILGQQNDNRTSYSTTNDLFYDRCVGAKMIFPVGMNGLHEGAFQLGRGSVMKRIGCRSFATGGSSEASGMHWSSKSNPDPNVWVVEDNVDHNNVCGGARVWQNDANHHQVDNTVQYHNGFKKTASAGDEGFGFALGAYGNLGYRIDGLYIKGSGAGLVNPFRPSKGIVHHTAGKYTQAKHLDNPSPPRAVRRSDGYYHVWENGAISNVDIGGMIPRHFGAALSATLIKNFAYSDILVAVFWVEEFPFFNARFSPGWYHVVDCTLDGLPLQSSDIHIENTLPGFLMEVQNGSDAWSIDENGTVTVIDPFYPRPPTLKWADDEIL